MKFHLRTVAVRITLSMFAIFQASDFKAVAQNNEADSPCLVVSATKMNVLYRGVKNPVSIQIPGMPDYIEVIPSVSNGTITPSREGNGIYLVEVIGGSAATVNVNVNIDGEIRLIGQYMFRVKDVPRAIATIAGKEGGLISASRLAAAPTVIPKIENFDFELFFKVTKFDLVYQVGADLIAKNVVGSKIPPDAIAQIKRLKKGARVYIENVKAIMLNENNRPASGVTPRNLSPISLKIQ